MKVFWLYIAIYLILGLHKGRPRTEEAFSPQKRTSDQCSGSMTFWCGSGSCHFRHWPSRRQQKTNWKKNFLLITFWRYIYIKDKKSKTSHKTVGIKVFLLFLHDDRRIWIREGQKHVDPVDPGTLHPALQSMRIRIRSTGKSRSAALVQWEENN